MSMNTSASSSTKRQHTESKRIVPRLLQVFSSTKPNVQHWKNKEGNHTVIPMGAEKAFDKNPTSSN